MIICFKAHSVSHDSMTQKHEWMDSDSDIEDFQHVLQESRRGLKFIESTIRLDCNISENGMPQDPAAFVSENYTWALLCLCEGMRWDGALINFYVRYRILMEDFPS